MGHKVGLWIVVPQQLVVQVGVNIVYIVTGGRSLKKFHDVICDGKCKDIKLNFFIMIFASIHFVLSQLPNLNSISGHNVVLEIQATIPSTSEKPSKKPMWKGVTLSPTSSSPSATSRHAHRLTGEEEHL
ncbi:hypothetical protein QYE76_033516 [Lolium multiflorum]|uniref:Amino acid transporter transmembrane domain-containing protein n=1 Tax=Lolium multiflorum TaxID=4521 RepID=A0AAD8VMF8_LOLMU|nr:hypothetical protein QYE76_033516 [Lolium multiflorum]